MNRRTIWWTVAAMLTLTTTLCVPPAGAEPMIQGTQLHVVFDAPAGNAYLAATAIVTLSTLTSNSATFDILISNNTPVAGDPNARLTAFGFRLTPTPTADPAIAITD